MREQLNSIGEEDAVLEHEFEVNGEEYRTIDYQEFIPHLINCIKDQQNEIDSLKQRIDQLESIVNTK